MFSEFIIGVKKQHNRTINNKIHNVQGNKVMLDFDLAELYEVETRVLRQAVRRNLKHFPDDFFSFQKKSGKRLSQIVITFPKTSNLAQLLLLPLLNKV